jgi:hypothetical protein
MKTFMAIYLGFEDSPAMQKWNALDEATQKARDKQGMEAWVRWGEKNAAAIVDNGPPLGKTKRVGPNGVSDVRNDLTGYVIVRAESHEAAAKLFLDHPHFTIFPGAGVEVMECLPMPEMPA